MHTQRTIISIAAGAGGLGVFLPWVSSPLGSMSGTAGPDGWIVLGAFAICLIAALLGKREQPLRFGLLCGSLIPCLLALMVGVSKLGVFHKSLVASELVRIGPGIYLIVLGGSVALIAGCLLAPQKRAVGGSLLWISIGGLVAGLVTFSWWSYKAHGGVGLLGFQNCTDAGCETKMFMDILLNGSEAEKAGFLADHTIWYTAAFLTVALSALATLVNVVDAFGAATGRLPAWRSRLSIGFCGGVLVSAVAFTVMAPAKVTGMGAMGASVALTIAGALLGILGGLIFGRSIECASTEIAIEIDEIPDTPTCSRCGAASQFFESQSKFICVGCKQIVG